MQKSHILKTAYGMRKARQDTMSKAGRLTGINTLQAANAMFDVKVESLSASERSSLLETLSSSLKRERRRCKGRKPDYDPGRHICLYAAVKSLEALNMKPLA